MRGTARHVFALQNDLAELDRVESEVADFGARHELPTDAVFALRLALEEVVSNIISYGFDDRKPHVIDVELEVGHGSVTTTVRDDGHAFNPLSVPEPDVTVPLEQRAVGGLGLMLVRRLMDEVTYVRDGERNSITFRKLVATGGPDESERGGMDMTDERSGEVTTVSLKGRLDGTTSKATEERLLQLVDQGQRKLILDLKDLDFISSVGLRVLMLTAKQLKTVNGTMVVCSLQPNVKQVFDIAGFSTLFRSFETRAQALAALQTA